MNRLVLGDCAGSGSTLVAASRGGRGFVGIEKEEAFFNIAMERLASEGVHVDTAYLV